MKNRPVRQTPHIPDPLIAQISTGNLSVCSLVAVRNDQAVEHFFDLSLQHWFSIEAVSVAKHERSLKNSAAAEPFRRKASRLVTESQSICGASDHC